jgi:tetratricopeptide (TPR) repeat protein
MNLRCSSASLALLMGVTGLTCLSAAPAPAPAAAAKEGELPLAKNSLDLADINKAAFDAFNAGDYAAAAPKLIQLAKSAEALSLKEGLPDVYYMIGIASGQIKAWAQSLEYLRKYETQFPTGQWIKDVSMLIGKVNFFSGDFKASAAQFEKIRNIPELRDEVLPLLGEAYEKSDQGAEAVKVLLDYLKGGYGSTERINAALRLATLYLSVDQPEKGIEIIDKIKNNPSAADFVIIINAKALETAIPFVEDKPELALVALQAVRRKSEVIRLQEARNLVLTAKIADATRAKAALKGPAAAKIQPFIDVATDRLKQLQGLLESVKKDESYDAVVLYQIGRTFNKLHRFWESELAFRTIGKSYPMFTSASSAVFGQIISLVELKRKEDALKLCKEYLKTYPKGGEVPQVAELAVTMSMEAGDFVTAVATAEEILKALPDDSPVAPKLRILVVTCQFSLYAFKDARAGLDAYRKKWPNDANKEEIDYRYALTYFFENNYAETIKQLGAFISAYPNSPFKSDARYRLGIVMYGEEQAGKSKAGQAKKLPEYESNFRRVINEVNDILANEPNTTIAGELYALLGDCYDQMTPKEAEAGNIDVDKESGDAFMQGALKATNDDVLDYTIEQARTKLQAAGRWTDMRKLHEEFVNSHPNHPDKLKAIYWVCKARSREAKTPEEKLAANEFNKKFLSTQVLSNINRANTEGVEMLLEQLAQACVPKRKPKAVAPGPTEEGKTAPATPTPVAAPSEPEEDPFVVGSKELDKWLGGATGKLNGTGEARLQYAKVQLLKMVPPKIDPADPKKRLDRSAEVEKLMDEMAQNVKVDDLSSTLCAFVGEHLRKRGVIEKATQCYNRLMNTFPKSDYADFALVGLGDIAFEQKNWAEAEKDYAKAKDELPGMKYPNALMGVAKAQFMQQKYDQVEKPLLEIVGNKDWKGELTAEALFWLGQNAFAQKKYAEAVNYYQRIFLSFGKFSDWAIKGYTEAAESFRALGEPDKAKAHLIEARDYLKKRKLEGSPAMQLLKDKALKLNIPLGS